MWRYVDAPQTTNPHAFYTVFQPGDDAASAHDECCFLIALHAVTAVQVKRVADGNNGPTHCESACASYDFFDLYSTSPAHARNHYP